MKRSTTIVFMLIALVLLLLPACSSSDTPATNGELSENGDKPTYKETMLPFEELVPAERIVLLQNTINFTREGFYDAENKPTAEEIEYKGNTVDAYSMNYALGFLTNGITGDLTITKNDGSSQTITAEDFAGLYIIIDFTSDNPPVLYNPQTGTEITDFLFATTAEGEAIYSIVSGSVHSTAEIIANVGWDTDATYRYMASDKFYIPVGPAENATGEIRGTLSGSINGSFPDLDIASGKINDLVYIEVIK